MMLKVNRCLEERKLFNLLPVRKRTAGALAALVVIAATVISCGNVANSNPSSVNVGITAFALEGTAGGDPQVNAFVDNDLCIIQLNVPYNAKLDSRVPAISFSGERIEPQSGEAQNFLKPLKYTVFSKDGTQVTYYVSVNLTDNPAVLDTFRLSDALFGTSGTTYTGMLSITSGTTGAVTFTVPAGTDTTQLYPFTSAPQDDSRRKTTSIGPNLTLEPNSDLTGSGALYVGKTALNFADKQTFVVKASLDGAQHERTYTVNVQESQTSEAQIWFFELPLQISSNINQSTGEITVKLSGRYDPVNGDKSVSLKKIVPHLAYRGASITPSDQAEQDFSNPVTYTVTSASGAPKVYTVKVTVLPPGEGEIEGALADLSSLTVSATGALKNPLADLNFNSAVTEYELATEELPTGAGQLLVEARAQNTGAKITYIEAGVEISSGRPFESRVFERGKHGAVTIKVEGKDGSAKTYTVSLYRGRASADLAELNLERAGGTYDMTLYPYFDKDALDYTVYSKEFTYNNRVKIQPRLQEEQAKVTIQDGGGNTLALDALAVPINNTTGLIETKDDMKEKALPGVNSITIKVVSEDRETEKEYTIHRYAWVAAGATGKIPQARGGTVSYVGNDEVHVFETSTKLTELNSTFEFLTGALRQPQTMRVLLLGGGGGTGGSEGGVFTYNNGGGGGAGQFKEEKAFAVDKASYTVKVGKGGKYAGENQKQGDSGGATVFDSLRVEGGGGGYAYDKHDGRGLDKGGQLVNGVPKGGNGHKSGVGTGNGGGGGGAGAGGDGKNGKQSTGTNEGDGGPGVYSDITGTNREYGKGASAGQYYALHYDRPLGGNTERSPPFSSDSGGGNGVVIVRFTRHVDNDR